MGIESINEPGQGHTFMLQPASINEPPKPQDAPVLSALTPASCTVGQPDFTLVISGEGLNAQSVIIFAGHEEPTTFNEADGTVSTGVKPSLWGSPVVVQCQVHNGLAVSNALDFSFEAEGTPLAEQAHGDGWADPDDLEDEIDQAVEEGDAEAAAPWQAFHDVAAQEALMGWPVVTVASGGIPVIDVTAVAPKAGAPVTEAANGKGTAVTKVAVGGIPVVYVVSPL